MKAMGRRKVDNSDVEAEGNLVAGNEEVCTSGITE